MKKTVFAVLALFLVVFCVNAQPVVEETETVSLNIAALKGPTAMGMVELMENSGDNYSFTLEGSPDAIVPLIAKGEVDIAAVPANLAAVLYNNTNNVKVIAVNTLGVLYLVGNGGEKITSREDVIGKTIYSAGKGSTPQYALESILASLSLVDGKDVFIEWKSEHAECVAALISDPESIAMLPQPFATSALMQNKDISIVLDLNEIWEELTGSPLITGCLIARNEVLENHKGAVEVFLEEYSESVDWVNSNNAEAAVLIEKYGIIKAAVAEKALPYCNIVCMRGDEMEKALDIYYNSLYTLNPKSVGGSIPGEEIYF
ncbi:MAG: ABC transporter substrate-binding protein [Candidatus Ornithospirochaeta sp.]